MGQASCTLLSPRCAEHQATIVQLHPDDERRDRLQAPHAEQKLGHYAILSRLWLPGELEELVYRVSGGIFRAEGKLRATLTYKDDETALLSSTDPLIAYPTHLRDRVGFRELIFLGPSIDGDVINTWFDDLSESRDNKGITSRRKDIRRSSTDSLKRYSSVKTLDGQKRVIDAFEFAALSILVSNHISLCDKVELLYKLFDLNSRGDGLSRDEVFLLLRSVLRAILKFHANFENTSAGSITGNDNELHATVGEIFEHFASSKGTLNCLGLCRWILSDPTAVGLLILFSRSDSVILATGNNHRYQCGVGIGDPLTLEGFQTPLLSIDSLKIITIAAKESHSLFLDSNGRVLACGSGFCGILGTGDTRDCTTPTPITFPQEETGADINQACSHPMRIVDIAVGIRHSVAISADGDVYCWGNDDVDQLGLAVEESYHLEKAYDHRTGGTFTFTSRPTMLKVLHRIGIKAKSVSCTNFSTTLLTQDNRMSAFHPSAPKLKSLSFSWGLNSRGQCGTTRGGNNGRSQVGTCVQRAVCLDKHMMPECTVHTIPIPIEVKLEDPEKLRQIADDNSRGNQSDLKDLPGPRITSLSCGVAHVVAVDDNHNAWAWGDNSNQQLALAVTEAYSDRPTVVPSLRGLCEKTVSGGNRTVFMTRPLRVDVNVNGSNATHVRSFTVRAQPLANFCAGPQGPLSVIQSDSVIWFGSTGGGDITELLEDAVGERTPFSNAVVILDYRKTEDAMRKLSNERKQNSPCRTSDATKREDQSNQEADENNQV
ncbi:hypothetical protein FOL47_009835 [Perkinsus chesapeaki]|uniref:E3 ubiquitin-protein ligase herc2 n=1 Tax=Perkinsus chesapeaki TaxID=330153 RepID=A0A7J6L6A1_PERCH|nr:hypothetical protein FOL47_009835 [Perkinsus chesapeaki]